MAVELPVAGDDRDAGADVQLRLLWLIDSLTMGGAESLAVSFARGIRGRKDIALTVCARTDIAGNPLESEIRAAGADVVNLRARRLIDRRAFRELLSVVRQRRINLIHAHLTYSSIWGALASRETGVPVVATLHVPPQRGGIREALRQRALQHLLNRYARKTVLVSDSLREAWASALRNTAVIRNGIPLQPPTARDREARRELGVSDDAPLVTSVAVLRPGKGIDVLIRAAHEIRASIPNAQFAVVGDGPLREEWAKLANDRGIPFHWTGYRRDVDRILGASELLVLPSLTDAFPTVLLEAMAASLPVVASRVGGIPEIVEDGVTGVLVSPGDPAALANAVVQALRDDGWRREAGAAARARVEREFSLEVWIERLVSLYREVCAS